MTKASCLMGVEVEGCLIGVKTAGSCFAGVRTARSGITGVRTAGSGLTGVTIAGSCLTGVKTDGSCLTGVGLGLTGVEVDGPELVIAVLVPAIGTCWCLMVFI